MVLQAGYVLGAVSVHKEMLNLNLVLRHHLMRLRVVNRMLIAHLAGLGITAVALKMVNLKEDASQVSLVLKELTIREHRLRLVNMLQ